MVHDEEAAAGKSQDEAQAEPSGAEPLLGEPPIVEIGGETYSLRRLGIRDTFRLARIIAAGAGAAMTNIKTLAGLDEDELSAQAAFLFFAGLPYSEGAALDLLASVIDVKVEDIRDPEKFPMGSELVIAEALAEHQDMRAFFARLGRLLTKPSLQGLLRSPSTQPNDDTAG